MYNAVKKVPLIIIVLSMLCGCAANAPITTRIFNEIGGNLEDTKEFQYYVSKTIVLTLVDESNATSIEEGRLVRKSNTSREKIVIKGNLPGLVRNAGLARISNLEEKFRAPVLYVAFEDYDGDPVLRFCQHRIGADEKYFLVYDDPENNIVQYGNDKYRVSYSDKLTKIVSKNASLAPYLLIKMKSSSSKSAKSRKASGLKLGK